MSCLISWSVFFNGIQDHVILVVKNEKTVKLWHVELKSFTNNDVARLANAINQTANKRSSYLKNNTLLVRQNMFNKNLKIFSPFFI